MRHAYCPIAFRYFTNEFDMNSKVARTANHDTIGEAAIESDIAGSPRSAGARRGFASRSRNAERGTCGTIVIAEDDEATRMLLDHVLTQAGFTVHACENGQLACDAVRRGGADVVLLDWMMPVMDGPTTAAAIRNDPVLARLPIVFMSGASESFLRSRFQDYSGFLHKPFLDEELLAVVAKVFAGATRSE